MGGGKGGSKQEVYDYLMSLDYGICHGPLDSINVVTVKDKIALQKVISRNSILPIDDPELFGGDKAEGGMIGMVEYFLGGYNQYSSPELAARFGLAAADMPAYRGLAHMFFRGEKTFVETAYRPTTELDFDPSDGITKQEFIDTVVGVALIAVGFVSDRLGLNQKPKYGFRWTTNNPYLPPPKIHVTRRPRGLSSDSLIWPIIRRENGAFVQSTSPLNPDGSYNKRKAPDANPAHMLYELMTNADWGKGDPESAFNKASYLACAATLKEEKFGLSMKLMEQDKIESFASEILDHVKAMQYQDPTTGLWNMKLIRDDYVVDDLTLFAPFNCEALAVRKRTWPEIINQIRVTYTEPFSEEEEAVTAENNAAIAIQGGVISETRDYYGVRNKFLAQQIADRDVAEASRILTTVKLRTDRNGFDKKPGDVIKFTWPDDGIVLMVLRITSVDWGSTTDRKIVFEATEDIYATPKLDFQSPEEVVWVDPDGPPTVADRIFITDPPLPILSQNGYTVAEVDANYPQSSVMFFINDQEMAIIDVTATATVVDGNGGTSFGTVATFPPAINSALGVALIPEVTSELPAGLFEALNRGTPRVGDIFMLQSGTKQEWIMLDGSVSVNSTWRVIRGLWDTVPLSWASTDRIWKVVGTVSNTDNREVFYNDNLTYYFQPRTRGGLLPRSLAGPTTYTVKQRIHQPFRPANTKVNGKGLNETQQYLGGVYPATIPVTWANRNRTAEDAVAKKWNAATVTPETGQTTRIKMMDASSGAVEFTYDLLPGTSFDLNTNDFVTYRFYDVGFYAVRDGIESFTGSKRGLEIERLGWGNNFGYDWSENDG